MGRKTQITKEQMLEAGLQLILREGHEAIAIKTVAKELHCSTQPISWSFGSIENYSVELMQYALEYLKRKMLGGEKEPLDYRGTVEAYVKMAMKEPNLIRYIRSDVETLSSVGGIGTVFDDTKNIVYRAQWAEQLKMTEENALAFMRFLSTYTEGVVSMVLSGALSVDTKAVKGLLDEAEATYKTYLKAERKEDKE